VSKRSVYWVVLTVWTVGAIVSGYAIKDDIGGRFKENWFLWTAFIFCWVGLLGFFLQWVRRLAMKAGELSSVQASPNGPDFENHIALVQGMSPMSEKPKVIIQSPGVVNVHHNTTHNNVQGGIVGSGTVTVHQHFDQTRPPAPVPEPQSDDPVVLIPIKETANLDELLEYAETELKRPLAENTMRNILERADVESCGEEKRGRARAKVYPREQAEKAIDAYVKTNK